MVDDAAVGRKILDLVSELFSLALTIVCTTATWVLLLVIEVARLGTRHLL